MFIGNIFVFFQFKDENLNLHTINVVFIVLAIVSAVGIAFLCTLRPPKTADGEMTPPSEGGAIAALKNSFKLFATKEMMLLLITFFYTGKCCFLCVEGCYVLFCKTKN